MTEDKITEVCSQLATLLKEKNKKYGDSFTKTAQQYGNIVIPLRINDKLNRLNQILINGEKDNMPDESVLDTLIDIAGYAVLSKIYLEERTK